MSGAMGSDPEMDLAELCLDAADLPKRISSGCRSGPTKRRHRS